MSLYLLEKEKGSQEIQEGSTGMEDQNPCCLRLLQKLKKQGNQTNLKTPKKVSPKTLEKFHSMVTNSGVGGKSLTD
jgi:hypothetical protein